MCARVTLHDKCDRLLQHLCSGLRSSEPGIAIIRDFWRKLIETISGGWCTLIETGRTLIETGAI